MNWVIALALLGVQDEEAVPSPDAVVRQLSSRSAAWKRPSSTATSGLP